MFVNDSDHYDQHFLIDDEIIKKFINTCNIVSTDTIVEIGPGDGMLTKELVKKAKKVIAFELDTRLKSKLDMLQKNNSNLEVRYTNALDSYLPACNKIITALPYSIIEPFVNKLIKCEFDEVIMIMGNKYVEGVINQDITKLSLLTNCFFEVEKYFDIEPKSFNPPPRVLSSVIKLKKVTKEDLIGNKLLYIFRELYFRKLLKLKKSLMEAFIDYAKENGNILTKKDSKEYISRLGIPDELLNKSFEALSNEELKKIYEILKKC